MVVATNSCVALETYFGRSLGLALLALGFTIIVLSGALPLDSTSKGKQFHFPFKTAVTNTAQKLPMGHPLLTLPLLSSYPLYTM